MEPVNIALEKNALGLMESTVMGVAGTAPVFSIAATSATLIAAVGLLAPASLLYCGLIMLGVTFAYMHLNRWDTNAGATYAWVSKVFGQLLGFLAGWALLVASAVFMVSGTVPAATSILALVAPAYVNNTAVVSLVAAGWLIAVSAVIIKGVKLTSYLQVLLTVVELVIVLCILVGALVQYMHHPAHILHLTDFSWTQFSPHLFATGALTAIFFYWGWDVTINLNEETRDGGWVAGLGSLLAMIIIMALFILFIVATLMVLSDAEIQAASTNIVLAVAQKIFPAPWSNFAVLAVMLSTLGTLETSILQFTRTMFAQARDGMLNPRYARLHAKWHTPWLATLVITLFGLILLLAASKLPTVNDIIQDSVDAIGFQATFYYGLACFASAWIIWKGDKKTPFNIVFLMLWPLMSGLFLWGIGVYSLPTFNTTSLLFAVGGILVGVVPFWLNKPHRLASAQIV